MKIGGSVAGEDAAALASIAALNDGGHSLVVVHGGGALEEPAGEKYEVLNVNADSAAGAIAASLGARLLVFVTDVPGVRSKEGRVLARLDRERAKELVDDGTIEGGMLPKVEACLVAASAGCRWAVVDARSGDAIERLLAGERVGTVFEAAA